MKKNPLISFCIATYKRPEFLKTTIASILLQDYKSIEIIVSDNDPLGSSADVVNSFNSKKIHYYKNKKNLGMVKNFNKAFSYAKGDFITFVADDDPIEKHMLKTLIPLYFKYPQADSFFGASNVYVQNQQISKIVGLKKGFNSLTSNLKKKGEITVYTPDSFLEKFFNYEITPYFLWSSGFAKKSLVKKIGGMPDYGSPFLTDYTYICLLGSLGTSIIINKGLARQTIHNTNFGRTEESLQTLPIALKGFHKKIFPFIHSDRQRKTYYTFINNWTIDNLLGFSVFQKEISGFSNKKFIINIYDHICSFLPFFTSRRFELYTKIHHPKIAIPYWKLLEKIKKKILLFAETIHN